MQTYANVKKQIAQLEKKAVELRKAEARNVIATIKAQIAEFELTAADLGFKPNGQSGRVRKGATAERPKAPPKYMDPETGKTWNGIGKAPLWIAAATRKGRRDDFLIERVTQDKGKKGGAKPAATKKVAKPVTRKNTSKVAARKAAPARKKTAASAKTTAAATST